jgi:hypothetical protein
VDVDKERARDVLLEVVAGPEDDGERRSMVGWHEGDGGVVKSVALLRWPSARAESGYWTKSVRRWSVCPAPKSTGRQDRW